MSKQLPEGESVNSSLGEGLGELSGLLPNSLQVKRGRPSRKKIEMMIAAPKSPALHVTTEAGSLAPESKPTIETLFGTGSLLNPDIQVEFVDSIDRSKQQGNYFPRLFHFMDQMVQKPVAYQGLVSPEALAALGVASQGLKSFVRKKHGYAVYFCNLDIESESLCINQWQQQIIARPEFELFAASFLDAAGLDSELLNHVLPSSALASFELLIGTPQFWTELKSFLQFILQTALNSAQSDELRTGLGNHGKALAQCLMVEFIRRSKHLKSFKFKSTQLESRLNSFMLEMRTMKDLACKSKSAWLLNCWGNYSMLYQGCLSSGQAAAVTSLNKTMRARFFS
jgi:hypothetical protein